MLIHGAWLSSRSWDTFADFHGMEETVMSLYSYFLHATQGLEERKQVLYLLGPVGGGKSSLAETIKSLCEKFPIYALKDSVSGRISPILESPLGLFNRERFGEQMEERYGIPRRALSGIASPWALKRLKEFKGDLTKFRVVRMMPSVLNQIGIVKTEPAFPIRSVADRGSKEGVATDSHCWSKPVASPVNR